MTRGCHLEAKSKGCVIYMKFKRETGKTKRRGYTTGACAQAATRAAVLSLAGGGEPSVSVVLPDGQPAVFAVTVHGQGFCSVVKDAGDDPDITDGVEVFARVQPRRDGRVYVKGGEGVGRVTLAGLAIKPGRPAINPVPLRHIRREARATSGGADVTISIPAGAGLARRTFNPRLGIAGGISVLGTTGRVEPWSAAAYQESLLPQLDMARAAGVRRPVLVPGGKGEKAALKAGFQPRAVVQAGNFMGFMLAAARERGFKQVALAGHASKLLKLARGDFNTHSRVSPMPLNVLAECAEVAGFSRKRAAALKLLPTTEAVLDELKGEGGSPVLEEGARRVAAAVKDRYGLAAEVLLTDRRGRVVARV